MIRSQRRLLCVMPSIPLGGMERAVIRIVRALMGRGFQSTFVLNKRWALATQSAVETIGADWVGVPFVASFSRPRTLLEAALATRSYLLSSNDIAHAAAEYQPNQILVTSFNAAVFARNISRNSKIRSIFRVPNPPGLSGWSVKSKIDRALWRSVYKDYDALVCNSDYSAKQVADFVGNWKRIHVIRNLIPDRRLLADSDAPKCDRGRINIAYLGQISKAKGVDILVEAALNLIRARSDVDFTLAGPDVWRDSFGREIRDRVIAHRAESRIRFVGMIADVHGFLEQTDLLVCPSVSANESFPNVVLDAKSVAVPAIVFPTAGLPESVIDGENGFVLRTCTAAELFCVLNRLCGNAQLRKRLSTGAFRSVADYSSERVCRDWESLLF